MAITGSEAFDRVLAELHPLLSEVGYLLTESFPPPQPFGSRAAGYERGRARLRLAFDEREKWFALEVGAVPDHAQRPRWQDLAVIPFDPTTAGEAELAAVIAQLQAALAKRRLRW